MTTPPEQPGARAASGSLAGSAHEFRTLVTQMLGQLGDVLAEAGGLPSATRERLNAAHRNGLRLLELVNAAQDFSRIEAGPGQRDALAALRESEAKFSTAFDRSPLALTITSVDDGRLVEINESFVQLSGYSREEALGRTPEELGLWIEPEVRAERFARLRAGERVPNLEARFRVKSGGS